MQTIAIIGRANVGKSTLFNRLSKSRGALVSALPGTTRDLKYAAIDWLGKTFELVDTGGFLASQKQPLKALTKKEQKHFRLNAAADIDKQVEQKARQALMAARSVIFLVDGQEGLNVQDKEIAAHLRKIKNKKIFLVVNKCDNLRLRESQGEFFKLGLGEPLLISAASGAGTGDLLDRLAKTIKTKTSPSAAARDTIKVSILGKPNAGKSSLMNKLSGQERALVSAVAHTTREPHSLPMEYKQQAILLSDTAGIRRKARIEKNSLENIGVRMSFGSISSSDIVLFMLDLNEGITHQDLQLAKKIVESGSGVILVANKYDLIKKDASDSLASTELVRNINQNFPHLSWAPIVLASAKTGLNTQKILDLILLVHKNSQIKIPTSALSKFLKNLIKKQPPPRKRIGFGKKTRVSRPFISHFYQTYTQPPTFECTVDSKEKLEENYRQYILNNLRTKFGFIGVPLKLTVKHAKP